MGLNALEKEICLYALTYHFFLIESKSGCSCLQWDSGKEHSLCIWGATTAPENRNLWSHLSGRCWVIVLLFLALNMLKNLAWALLIIQRLKTSQHLLKATCCLIDGKRCANKSVLQRRGEYLGLQTCSKAYCFSSSLKIPGEFWGSNTWLHTQGVL